MTHYGESERWQAREEEIERQELCRAMRGEAQSELLSLSQGPVSAGPKQFTEHTASVRSARETLPALDRAISPLPAERPNTAGGPGDRALSGGTGSLSTYTEAEASSLCGGEPGDALQNTDRAKTRRASNLMEE